VAKIRFSFESVRAVLGHFTLFFQEFFKFLPSLHNNLGNVQLIYSEIRIFAALSPLLHLQVY